MTTQVDEKIKETVGPALGRVASGVHIVTVAHSDETGGNDGMLATWVIQASFNPPLLTVAVNSERAIYKSLKKGAEFGVNVLSKDNMDIFKSFAKPHTEGMDRFEGHELLDDMDKQGEEAVWALVERRWRGLQRLRPSRFLLCKLAKHAQRQLHRPFLLGLQRWPD